MICIKNTNTLYKGKSSAIRNKGKEVNLPASSWQLANHEISTETTHCLLTPFTWS